MAFLPRLRRDAGRSVPSVPVVPDQSIDFGARTRSGNGGYVLTNIGAAITLVNGGSSATFGSWTATVSGGVCTITPNVSNPTGSSTTLTFNGGDTALITCVTTGLDANGNNLANAFSVANATELNALWLLTKASGNGPAYGDCILLRSGTYGALSLTRNVTTDYFAGTFTAPTHLAVENGSPARNKGIDFTTGNPVKVTRHANLSNSQVVLQRVVVSSSTSDYGKGVRITGVKWSWPQTPGVCMDINMTNQQAGVNFSPDLLGTNYNSNSFNLLIANSTPYVYVDNCIGDNDPNLVAKGCGDIPGFVYNTSSSNVAVQDNVIQNMWNFVLMPAVSPKYTDITVVGNTITRCYSDVGKIGFGDNIIIAWNSVYDITSDGVYWQQNHKDYWQMLDPSGSITVDGTNLTFYCNENFRGAGTTQLITHTNCYGLNGSTTLWVPTVSDALGVPYSITWMTNQDNTSPYFSGAGLSGEVSASSSDPNVIVQAGQFDNAAWTKTGATVTANATRCPIESSAASPTADLIVEDASTGNHEVSQAVTGPVDGDSVTVWVYAKPNTRSWVFVGVVGRDGVRRGTWFNVSTGTRGTDVGGAVTGFFSVLQPYGFYELRVAVPVGTGASSPIAVFGMGTADNTPSYTGDGTSGLYLWKANLAVIPYLSGFPYLRDWRKITLGSPLTQDCILGTMYSRQKFVGISGQMFIGGTPPAAFWESPILEGNIGVDVCGINGIIVSKTKNMRARANTTGTVNPGLTRYYTNGGNYGPVSIVINGASHTNLDMMYNTADSFTNGAGSVDPSNISTSVFSGYDTTYNQSSGDRGREWTLAESRTFFTIKTGGPADNAIKSGALTGYINRSTRTALFPWYLPTNTVLPSISGTPQVGQTLTGSRGTWTGSPTSYTDQWYADGVAIPGATSTTFAPTATQVGKVITYGVIATNGVGSSTEAVSAGTAAVTALTGFFAAGSFNSAFAGDTFG